MFIYPSGSALLCFALRHDEFRCGPCPQSIWALCRDKNFSSKPFFVTSRTISFQRVDGTIFRATEAFRANSEDVLSGSSWDHVLVPPEGTTVAYKSMTVQSIKMLCGVQTSTQQLSKRPHRIIFISVQPLHHTALLE